MSRSDEVWTTIVATAAVLIAVGGTVVVVSAVRDDPAAVVGRADGSSPPATGVDSGPGGGFETTDQESSDPVSPDPTTTEPTRPGVATSACVPHSPSVSPDPAGEPRPITFATGAVRGADLDAATSIDVGPDGRVYVAQQDGMVVVFQVERRGAADFVVVDREEIDLVRRLPNHDDEGRPQREVTGRLVTGLLVGGTASAPCLYVSSSDPRIGGGPDAVDLGGDTNSGVVSRLDLTADGWQRTDLVRGLPRSREAHATNGLELDPTTGTLLVAQGGNTNAGMPSPEFAGLPEYALSGAILAIDLAGLGQPPYDLPTTGRPAGAVPFGGAGGDHQAVLDPDGPVRILSPGWRNPYDLELTSSGRLYSFDNSAAPDWGAPPDDDDCTRPASVGIEDDDALREVVAGAYAGHPNPARATGLAVVGGAEDPRQCRSVTADEDPSVLATAPASTNGLVEYRSGAFGGALQGDLLAAEFSDRVMRLDLDEDGRVVGQEAVVSSFGGQPLDVTAQGDDEPFPGTVWVAIWRVFTAESSILVLDPDEAPTP